MPMDPFNEASIPERTVFCVGIYGSASTWVYNVCRQLMIASNPGDRVATLYADTPFSQPHPDLWTGPPIHNDHWDAAVIKMHEGSPEAFAAIQSGAVTCIISVRDPRDAVVSVMQRFKWNFDVAFDHVSNSLRFVDSILQAESSLVLRYEDLYMCEPQSIVRIAAHLHIDVGEREVMEIFSRLSPVSIDSITRHYTTNDEAISVDTAGRLYDKTTHWHQQHHGDGSVGKWHKYLHRRERKLIREACWKEMTRLGYASLGW